MKNIAIICEYNPFHNGHKYMLEEAFAKTDATRSIALMSGNFLQRGEAAMWDKYVRAKLAVENGIDLVLELPFCYATGSANDFANGAVSLLGKLNSVDYLCFGAETDDIGRFEELIKVISDEPEEYKNILKEVLKSGCSFAKARSEALARYMNDDSVNEFLSKSNNILAIEYMRAIKKNNLPMKPVLIKRKGSEYNDANLSGNFSSASAIRQEIRRAIACSNNSNDIFSNADFDSNSSNDIFSSADFDSADSVSIQNCNNHILHNKLKNIQVSVPANTYSHISDVLENKLYYMENEDFSYMLKSALAFKKSNYSQGKLVGDYSDICDANEDLSAKLNKLGYIDSFAEVSEKLSGKQYTKTRINRVLLHMLNGYTNSNRQEFLANGIAYYANILALKKSSSSFISEINSKSEIPLITKKADFDNIIKSAFMDEAKLNSAYKMWALDVKATELYNAGVYNKCGAKSRNDFNVILPVI